jgi:AcrR family transcriptional regulator
MDPLRFQDVARALEQFLGASDPDDPAYRKRMRIVEAATGLFLRHGYRKASVDEIAKRAGVAKGTVYLYFKTKADLLVHAVAVEKRRYVQAMQPILDDERSSRERLRAYLQRAVTLLAEMPLTSRLVGGDREITAVFDDLDPDARAGHEAMQIDFVTRLLDPAAGAHRWTEQELGDRARVLIALMYALGVFTDERVRGGLSLERFSHILADVIVDGIAAPSTAAGGRP